jgi:hypothetical protein
VPWNPNSYGLPLPPNQRQLGLTRNSPVRALIARYRGLSQRQPSLMAGRTPPAKPQVRQPARPPVIGGKLFTPLKPEVQRTRLVRDVLGLITIFARQHKIIRLIYRRLRDGAIIQRDVEPYSLRYLRTKHGGRARYFYGYDLSPPTIGIHSFRMSNILAVEGTDRVFTPRWVVEF